MATYLISLEQRTKRELSSLEKKIIQLSSHTPLIPLKGTWLIQTDLTAEQVRDELLIHVHAKDALLVIRVDVDNWASWNVHKNTEIWLNQEAV